MQFQPNPAASPLDLSQYREALNAALASGEITDSDFIKGRNRINQETKIKNPKAPKSSKSSKASKASKSSRKSLAGTNTETVQTQKYSGSIDTKQEHTTSAPTTTPTNHGKPLAALSEKAPQKSFFGGFSTETKLALAKAWKLAKWPPNERKLARIEEAKATEARFLAAGASYNQLPDFEPSNLELAAGNRKLSGCLRKTATRPTKTSEKIEKTTNKQKLPPPKRSLNHIKGNAAPKIRQSSPQSSLCAIPVCVRDPSKSALDFVNEGSHQTVILRSKRRQRWPHNKKARTWRKFQNTFSNVAHMKIGARKYDSEALKECDWKAYTKLNSASLEQWNKLVDAAKLGNIAESSSRQTPEPWLLEDWMKGTIGPRTQATRKVLGTMCDTDKALFGACSEKAGKSSEICGHEWGQKEGHTNHHKDHHKDHQTPTLTSSVGPNSSNPKKTRATFNALTEILAHWLQKVRTVAKSLTSGRDFTPAAENERNLHEIWQLEYSPDLFFAAENNSDYAENRFDSSDERKSLTSLEKLIRRPFPTFVPDRLNNHSLAKNFNIEADETEQVKSTKTIAGGISKNAFLASVALDRTLQKSEETETQITEVFQENNERILDTDESNLEAAEKFCFQNDVLLNAKSAEEAKSLEKPDMDDVLNSVGEDGKSAAESAPESAAESDNVAGSTKLVSEAAHSFGKIAAKCSQESQSELNLVQKYPGTSTAEPALEIPTKTPEINPPSLPKPVKNQDYSEQEETIPLTIDNNLPSPIHNPVECSSQARPSKATLGRASSGNLELTAKPEDSIDISPLLLQGLTHTIGHKTEAQEANLTLWSALGFEEDSIWSSFKDDSDQGKDLHFIRKAKHMLSILGKKKLNKMTVKRANHGMDWAAEPHSSNKVTFIENLEDTYEEEKANLLSTISPPKPAKGILKVKGKSCTPPFSMAVSLKPSSTISNIKERGDRMALRLSASEKAVLNLEKRRSPEDFQSVMDTLSRSCWFLFENYIEVAEKQILDFGHYVTTLSISIALIFGALKGVAVLLSLLVELIRITEVTEKASEEVKTSTTDLIDSLAKYREMHSLVKESVDRLKESNRIKEMTALVETALKSHDKFEAIYIDFIRNYVETAEQKAWVEVTTSYDDYCRALGSFLGNRAECSSEGFENLVEDLDERLRIVHHVQKQLESHTMLIMTGLASLDFDSEVEIKPLEQKKNIQRAETNE